MLNSFNILLVYLLNDFRKKPLWKAISIFVLIRHGQGGYRIKISQCENYSGKYTPLVVEPNDLPLSRCVKLTNLGVLVDILWKFREFFSIASLPLLYLQENLDMSGLNLAIRISSNSYHLLIQALY